MIISGIILGTFGLGRNFINDINFMWAWIYTIAIEMTGVVYSKELFIGEAIIKET